MSRTVSVLLFPLLLLVALPAFSQSAARPKVNLPDGPIRSVLLKKCVACHGIDDYAFYALDRAGWKELLDLPHKQRNVALSGAEEELVLDYLSSSFGPESIPFPRNYVAPEITEYFSNPEARVFLERVCTECHELRVFEHRKDLAGWRTLVLDMRERGASLSNQNLEKLVEWLSRVRGVNPVE
jgi:hypothetical protein